MTSNDGFGHWQSLGMPSRLDRSHCAVLPHVFLPPVISAFKLADCCHQRSFLHTNRSNWNFWFIMETNNRVHSSSTPSAINARAPWLLSSAGWKIKRTFFFVICLLVPSTLERLQVNLLYGNHVHTHASLLHFFGSIV